jgi:phosphoribosylformylglycinamidine cyclo-ligase
MTKASKYLERGVSADKSEVHQAIRHLDKGLFPNAFCKILPDMVGGDEEYCNIMHADTAGTKPSLAYLYWRETGDESVWAGIVQDALVMNLDDMACVGCVNDFVISSTIARNKQHIPGEVISALIRACSDFADQMSDYGIRIHLAGGETADVGDIIRTLDVGYTAFARMKRSDLIINNIQAGDVIIGVASDGQASYEQQYNGGMGSNGLTSARHDVFSAIYGVQYPESFDPNIPAHLAYAGNRRVTDQISIPGVGNVPLGKLVLSPTRTYLPILSRLLPEFKQEIHGLIHCTGGGQTKVKKFLGNHKAIKDNLPTPPPLFTIIQEESKTSWEEMYEVFNMGIRLEIYTTASQAGPMIDLIQSFGIRAGIIGRVEAADLPSVELKTAYGRFEY